MEPIPLGAIGLKPGRMAMAALIESDTVSSYEGLIAAFRELEAAAAAKVREPDTWSGIQRLAQALADYLPSRTVARTRCVVEMVDALD